MIYDKIGPIIPPAPKILHLPRCDQARYSRKRPEHKLEMIG
jgi:hypothetical protein